MNATAAARKTLFFVDWDDTLLPSTWLLERGINESALDTSEEEKALLDRVDVGVTRFLSVLCELGTVVILTSASLQWLFSSQAAFLPRTALVAASLSNVSARDLYEEYFPGDPTAWKTSAMHDVMSRHFEHTCHRGNVISIGDSTQERLALFYAVNTIGGALAKSVKCIERPSVDVLVS
jgi:hypothetical protein